MGIIIITSLITVCRMLEAIIYLASNIKICLSMERRIMEEVRNSKLGRISNKGSRISH